FASSATASCCGRGKFAAACLPCPGDSAPGSQVPSGPLRPRKRPTGRQSARPLELGHGARGDGEGSCDF
ncbi:hypothetical protein LEMLEM_LOCUS11693, partial [Lemmus lemmus]